MQTDPIFKLLKRTFQQELENYAVANIYQYLLWHALMLTLLITVVMFIVAGHLPFSLFNVWGIPVFLTTNLMLGFSYFLFKKQKDKIEGFWVNWLGSVVFVISVSFSSLPWISFSFLPLEWLILCTLFMSLTPILAMLLLIGSERIWLAAVLPVMLSLIIYSATAWLENIAFGQWLAIWSVLLSVLAYLLQKRNNKLLHQSLVTEMRNKVMCDL